MVRAARCERCRFWECHDDYSLQPYGMCRVKSPVVVVVVEGETDTVWPSVHKDGWCGEWQEAYRKKEGDADG